MPTIYTDGYINIQDKKGLERIAKDKHTDQATRDKAKALLAQKSGTGTSGGGSTAKTGGASPSPTGGKSTTPATAPGHLIPAGSGTTPGGSTYGTTGSGTTPGGSTYSSTGSAAKTTGGSSYGSTGSGTKTTGSGSGGSAGVLDPNTLTDDQLRAWAAENSRLWHTNPELRGRYEAENRAINTILDKRNGTTSTLDPTTGKWTVTGGQPAQPQPVQQPVQQQPVQSQPSFEDLMAQMKDYVSQSQAAAPQYEPSQWERLAEKLAQAALDMKYEDWTQSDQYAALADRYGLQGQQSMQDILGQVSSRTGGLASSYAATAAQQGYNDYMSRLEEVARQMYAGERGDAIQNAQLAGMYSDRDYDRYLDRLAQYNKDQSYGFNVLDRVLSQSQYDQQWQNKLDQQEYQRGQDQYEDSLRWRDDARSRVDRYFALGGTLAELYSQFPDLITASGYNNAELMAMERHAAELRAQEETKISPVEGRGSSGTSGGTGSSGSSGAVVGTDKEENTGPIGGIRTAGGQRFPDLMQGMLTGGPVAPELGLGMGYETGDASFMDGLVKSGLMSPEDRDRILAAPNGGAIPSAGYEGIVRQLERAEDRAAGAGRKAGQIIQIIQTAQENGTIREDEAKYLLKRYGLWMEEE